MHICLKLLGFSPRPPPGLFLWTPLEDSGETSLLETPACPPYSKFPATYAPGCCQVKGVIASFNSDADATPVIWFQDRGDKEWIFLTVWVNVGRPVRCSWPRWLKTVAGEGDRRCWHWRGRASTGGQSNLATAASNPPPAVWRSGTAFYIMFLTAVVPWYSRIRNVSYSYRIFAKQNVVYCVWLKLSTVCGKQ